MIMLDNEQITDNPTWSYASAVANMSLGNSTLHQYCTGARPTNTKLTTDLLRSR